MSKRHFIFIALALLISVFLLSACTPADEPVIEQEAAEKQAAEEQAAESAVDSDEKSIEVLEIEDGLGRMVSITLPVQKIISLAPSNTEILFAIGAGDQLVGRDSVSNYPEQALEIADIGGGWGDLDTETILTMEPDLVLAAGLTAPEQIQTLESLDLTVFVVPNPTDLEGMFENLRIVAQITGHEQDADSLIADFAARVAAVEEAIAGVEERPTIFYELDATDPNAPWTPGPSTFHDTLIAQAGGVNIGGVLESAWAQINLEELIQQDPDIILLGDNFYGGVTPEIVAARAGWDGLSAVQNEQVYIFNDDIISRPGPRLVEGLEELAKFLHPELFE